MTRLRTVGTALLGVGVGYFAGAWITTYAHARARDQSAAGFVAESKQQIRATRDGRTEQHPGRAPDFDHEEFSETLAPGSESMFDPERWHSEGVDIDVVGPDDVDDNDHEGDDDAPDDPVSMNYIEELRDALGVDNDDDGDGENDDDDKRGTAP